MRRRRSVMLRTLIEQCFAAKGSVRLLDMGGEIPYWNILDPEYLAAHRTSITLVNLSEENLPHNPDPARFTNIIGDCCDLSFDDNSFDIAHSNSVIEHLGSWDKMAKFAAETRRVAHHYYVQTVSLVQRRAVGKGSQADNLDAAMTLINYYRLLDKSQFTHLFPDAQLVQEKFLGLTKSFVCIK